MKVTYPTSLPVSFKIGSNIHNVPNKIPIKDIDVIQIKGDYFSPFDDGISQDKRKLSLGFYQFIYEKQNYNYNKNKISKPNFSFKSR